MWTDTARAGSGLATATSRPPRRSYDRAETSAPAPQGALVRFRGGGVLGLGPLEKRVCRAHARPIDACGQQDGFGGIAVQFEPARLAQCSAQLRNRRPVSNDLSASAVALAPRQ